MAQGQLKKLSKPAAKQPSGITKKGSRTFTPRKAKLIKQAKITKKYTSGLTEKTEVMLGQRAGHLEMLGGGKKKSNAGEKSKAGGSKKVQKKV
jgi:hypothetical protein